MGSTLEDVYYIIGLRMKGLHDGSLDYDYS